MVHHRLVTRNTLVAALVACSDDTVKTRARRFLLGLSCDELQFIAEFLGSCILESSEDIARAADAVHSHQARMARHEDKIPILREFLGRCGRLACVERNPSFAANS
jgi:hypothetical protein